MKRTVLICLLSCLLSLATAWSQITPFTASWNFEGNSNGNSSSGLVTASSVTYTGVNLLAVNPYTTGYVNLGVNVQNWSTSLCNQTEYVQFSVQPVGTAKITLTSLSFAFARSAQGPQQLSVRSSGDGFSSTLYAQSVTLNYQVASIALNGPEFANQAGAITFRIYACNPTATGGTLKLDEIQLNATVLPVTLVSFTAKPSGNRVQLAWETASERNASHFRIERGLDSGEFVTLGEVAAAGTTTERQYYGWTDLNPRPGINYYRLSQLDINGTVYSYRPVPVKLDSAGPVVTVSPNPAAPDRIHLRFWNADGATFRLLSATGQRMDGRLERQAEEAELVFAQPLPAGLYWLEISQADQRKTIAVLVR